MGGQIKMLYRMKNFNQFEYFKVMIDGVDQLK